MSAQDEAQRRWPVSEGYALGTYSQDMFKPLRTAFLAGATCRCGYWNGTEEPGRTRPVGYQGLQRHQAEMVASLWGGGER